MSAIARFPSNTIRGSRFGAGIGVTPGFETLELADHPQFPIMSASIHRRILPGGLLTSAKRWELPIREWQWTDHHDGEGALQSKRWDRIRGSHLERLLRYHRPLVENGTIEFDFYYQVGVALTSPAVDRLALLFKPEGIVEHRVTDGRYDVTELRPDALQHHESYQRGTGPLPLKSGDWNHVELRFSGDTLSIRLNELLVYDRPLEPTMERTFGLFHFVDQHKIIARNIIMRGDWPKQIPGDQSLADARPSNLDAGLPKLDAVFAHDFRNHERTERFMRKLTFNSTADFAHVDDVPRLTVRSLGPRARSLLTSVLGCRRF